MLAVDVSSWLRPDAPTSAERLFCHVYGRGKNQAQLIPGWPYSFVAALETGRTSWTAVLDAIRLGPTDDATAVTAAQLREVVERLIAADQWRPGDPEILIVADAGYDITRLAFVLADLPVVLLGRLRSDRVLRLPAPTRLPGTTGRPPKHGGEFALARPASWPPAQHTTSTETTRYGAAIATSWDRLHPRLTHRTCWLDHDGEPVLHVDEFRQWPGLGEQADQRNLPRLGQHSARLEHQQLPCRLCDVLQRRDDFLHPGHRERRYQLFLRRAVGWQRDGQHLLA